MRKTKTPHLPPTRPAPKVEIINKEGQPAECRVTVGGVCVFDGVSREALAEARSQTVNTPPPVLGAHARLEFMVNGQIVEFYVTKINLSSQNIEFHAVSSPSSRPFPAIPPTGWS